MNRNRTCPLEAFFAPRANRFPGGERRYARAMENLRQCAAFRERQAPSVAAFLQR